MKLLTAELREQIPPLYSQEKVEDPIVRAKFFTPDSNWTWYVLEGEPDPEAGDFRFFGWVNGPDLEMGYFYLSELETARGSLGLKIERDLWFKPAPWSEVKKQERIE